MGFEQDQQPVIEVVDTLHSGMNDRDKPWALDQQTAVLLENLDPFKLGSRRKRSGVSSIGGWPTTPLGLGRSWDNAKSQEVLVAGNTQSESGTRAEIRIMTAGNEQLLVASDISTAGTQLQFVEGRWNVGNATFAATLQADDSDASIAALLTVWDRDRNASFNESMAPTVIAWWQNRLWAADNKFEGGGASNAVEETLWWSQLGDGLSFSDGNSFQVDPGRGGRITGFIPIRADSPRALIFKEDSVNVFQPRWGSSSAFIPQPPDALDFINSTVLPVTQKAGCVATGSIKIVAGAREGDIWFLSRDGIRAIARAENDALSSPTLPVSLPIQDTIDRINFEWAHKARAGVFDNKYFLAVPLDGAVANTHTIMRDLLTGAWYLYDWAMLAPVSARMTETREKLWFQYTALATDTVPGSEAAEVYHVYKAFDGVRDPSNSAIAYKETSRAFSFGDTARRKKYSWFGISLLNKTETAIIDVEVAHNGGSFNALPESPVMFPPIAAGAAVVMGETPLPWNASPAEVSNRKLNLEDERPSYFLQIRLTGQSDFAEPEIIQTQLVARPILELEFDNEIT